MHQTTSGEKLTAVLSAVAAVIILGAVVTAQQSRNVPLSRLAAMESDLRFQLNLAHRLNGETLKARLADLDRTLEAWRASPQSGDDYRLLAEWFDASIDQSMPGESGELPPTPKFGAAPPPVAAAPPTPPAVVPAPPAKTPTIAAAPHITQPPVARPSAAKPPVTSTPAPAPLAKSQPQSPPPQSPQVQPSPAVEHSVAVHVSPPATPAPQPAPKKQAGPPPTPASLASVKVEPVEINLPELNSRVEGYHHGLKEIEAALVAGRDQFGQDELADVVGRLEELANQYQFIRLYYDALTADERRAVTPPRPLRPTVDLVQREAARIQRGADGDFLSAFETPAAGEPSPLAARLKSVAKQAAEGDGSSR